MKISETPTNKKQLRVELSGEDIIDMVASRLNDSGDYIVNADDVHHADWLLEEDEDEDGSHVVVRITATPNTEGRPEEDDEDEPEEPPRKPAAKRQGGRSSC